MEDPDPRVAGRGIAKLERGGHRGRRSAWARARRREINAGFFLRLQEKRPLVTLKLAMTLDGRIATHTGESRWITGEAARARAHLLRVQHDAVMVGSGTALADDPLLNVRLPGLERHSPLRIVLDGRMRLPLTSALVAGARETPTWLVTLDGGGERLRRHAYQDCGVEVIEMPAERRGRDRSLQCCCAIWPDKGLTRVLAEGGARLAAALLQRAISSTASRSSAPPASSAATGCRPPPASASRASPSCRCSRRMETVVLGADRLETFTARAAWSSGML